MSRRAALYARISLDRHDGEGVGRQLADCRKLAAEKGWEIVGEYVDNDVSAFRAKRRPEWQRLLEDMDAGLVNALVAYHPDRTYRRTLDLEALIDVVERTGSEVATVKAGDIDLATATGRMGARIVAAVARHESERISERVKRVKAERAAEGMPPGGGFRPFGYLPGGMELDPVEADMVRDAADRVAAGATVGSVVRAWNAAGVTTTAGQPWTAGAVRRVLVSPRIAGIRNYKGMTVGAAAWPAIIDEVTHRRLRLMVEGRQRGRPVGETSLLSALITCPRCGAKLYANGEAYKCQPTTRGGCGRASILQRHADDRVCEKVGEWLDDPVLPAVLSEASHPVDVAGEVEEIRRRLVEQSRRYALGKINDAEYEQARDILNARLVELADVEPVHPDVPDLARIRQAWAAPDAPVVARRAVIAAIVERIDLTSGRMDDPRDRVTVTFRA